MNLEIFTQEKQLIESVLEPEEIIDIQSISSKENEIAVIVTPDEYIQSYVRPMLKIGYELDPENSSSKKLVFRNLVKKITLSLAQEE